MIVTNQGLAIIFPSQQLCLPVYSFKTLLSQKLPYFLNQLTITKLCKH